MTTHCIPCCNQFVNEEYLCKSKFCNFLFLWPILHTASELQYWESAEKCTCFITGRRLPDCCLQTESEAEVFSNQRKHIPSDFQASGISYFISASKGDAEMAVELPVTKEEISLPVWQSRRNQLSDTEWVWGLTPLSHTSTTCLMTWSSGGEHWLVWKSGKVLKFLQINPDLQISPEIFR